MISVSSCFSRIRSSKNLYLRVSSHVIPTILISLIVLEVIDGCNLQSDKYGL